MDANILFFGRRKSVLRRFIKVVKSSTESKRLDKVHHSSFSRKTLRIRKRGMKRLAYLSGMAG